MTGSPAKRLTPARRYQFRQVGAMVAYAVTLLTVLSIFKTAPPAGSFKYVLAVLPAIPILGIIAAIGLYLMEETDEFLRMKTVMLLLGGIAVTLAATTIWGFLEVLTARPHIPLYFVFPTFCVGMLLSVPIVAWRYR